MSISELTQMKNLTNVHSVANASQDWKTSKFTTGHIQVGYNDDIHLVYQKAN